MMYDPAQLEDLYQDMPTEVDIHYWTHGDDEEDEATVCRMLTAKELAEDPAEGTKQWLYQGEGHVTMIDD